MMDDPIYVVADIEADGPDPGKYSMLSFASVAVSSSGAERGAFQVNLKPLEGATTDPGTMAWWATEPEAWSAATKDPQPPEAAMDAFIRWVRALPGTRIFAGHALSFDGGWIDWYLQRFGKIRLYDRPREPGLFFGAGLDIPSLVMGVTGWDFRRCGRDHYPEDWLGGYAHSHCALDDARGYAALLGRMISLRGAAHPV